MHNNIGSTDVSFEHAIALSQDLLLQAETGESSETEIAATIAQLVKSETGARGFFVSYLTSQLEIADNPPMFIVQALQSSPEVVAELLVKNLAMSVAQTVLHHRHNQQEMAQGSERIHQRTVRLIELVNLTTVRDRLTKLLHSAATGEGSYQAFLERWGYDAKQLEAICQAISLIKEN